MRIVNLPKQLIYTDRRNLDDFLRDDELNEELYKVYLRVKDNPYYFKFSAETAFNEAYYIATMAMNEPHPELDVREWWYAAKRDIGWAYSANLIMSMVYAILSLQSEKPDTIDYVLEIMKGANYGEEHFPAYKEMVENHPFRYDSDFNIRPNSVEELRSSPILWQNVTEDFEQDAIRDLVAMFPTKEERLKFIDLIEQRQNELTSPDLGFLDSKYTSQMIALEDLPF